MITREIHHQSGGGEDVCLAHSLQSCGNHELL